MTDLKKRAEILKIQLKKLVNDFNQETGVEIGGILIEGQVTNQSVELSNKKFIVDYNVVISLDV